MQTATVGTPGRLNYINNNLDYFGSFLALPVPPCLQVPRACKCMCQKRQRAREREGEIARTRSFVSMNKYF